MENSVHPYKSGTIFHHIIAADFMPKPFIKKDVYGHYVKLFFNAPMLLKISFITKLSLVQDLDAPNTCLYMSELNNSKCHVPFPCNSLQTLFRSEKIKLTH